ncbi:hypothetical protein [Burkholderia cepacia]|uniref:Uncharacterized protein n=1 Tax=Burkholderia cepacia TaxID=292 RepID=A0ABM6NWF9_BURCE|nr:hypothetical protein [Burkholderia cepacia]AIO25010.1 hypothetical protein DM41_2951 [Burkholderia cepacia ATCC 25416]ALK18496.1 hypothetical protein APZ15_12140 [Burkholderia cepacia ATCC 25416]ASE96032.1 hypothetical protein CEQ23_22155 [Burkholderia cepacia]ATF78965.1 hypothetical protein CO711_17105 [Burkholderia cepacia]MCA8466897.1 hypothetical protein [Burkholderia cepacia]
MRTLTLPRAPTDNALLRVAARAPRLRRAAEAGAWMAAYGVAIAALWYGSLVAGPYLRSLG